MLSFILIRSYFKTKSKKGWARDRNPLCIGFTALRAGLRPRSRKGARPWVGVDPSLLKMSLLAHWEITMRVANSLRVVNVLRVVFRGRQVGDGMGGRPFWGHPDFRPRPWKHTAFSTKRCTIGAPQKPPFLPPPIPSASWRPLIVFLLEEGKRKWPILRRTDFVLTIRSFEKGLADKGGWREEVLHVPEIQASFLYPFSYAPLGEGGHISGELLGLFLGACLSPTPSRQPLFETSDTILIFFSLPFWKNKETPPKTARIRSRGRTPKFVGKQAKKGSKSKDFLEKKKARKSKTARKRRSG